jgi:hypothetical protein
VARGVVVVGNGAVVRLQFGAPVVVGCSCPSPHRQEDRLPSAAPTTSGNARNRHTSKGRHSKRIGTSIQTPRTVSIETHNATSTTTRAPGALGETVTNTNTERHGTL